MSNLSLNKAIIGGRLTGTPELKQTLQGVFVTTFTVAINRRGKQGEADFINCIAWRQTAEFICRYFKKGSSICVAGSLQKREWTDKNGSKRYAIEVVADEAYFVDGKGEGAETVETVQKPSFSDLQEDFSELSPEDDVPF